MLARSRLTCLFALAAAVLLAAGCGSGHGPAAKPPAGETGFPVEVVDAQGVSVRVAQPPQRIVSSGHVTPENQWYDQDGDEWVVVLRGSARLQFDGEAAPVSLQPGDYVLIPARRRHRVEWTQPGKPTVWLALHFADSLSPRSTDAG